LFNRKHHIGYGVLPASFLVSSFYTFYFSNQFGSRSIVVFSVVFTALILLLKKGLDSETILSYVGFKWLPFYERMAFLLSYYLLFLLLFGKLQPGFIAYIDTLYLLSAPFIFLFLFHYLMNLIQIEVLFVRISPNVYVDMISFHHHTFDEIKEYDVSFVLDDEITANKLVHFYKFMHPHAPVGKCEWEYSYEFTKIRDKVFITSENKTFGVLLDYGSFTSENMDELVFYIEHFEKKAKG